jgi:hypothetical protein
VTTRKPGLWIRDISKWKPTHPSFPESPIAGRGQPDPLAAIWEAEIVPMLTAMPGLRPITAFDEMQRRHAGTA